MEKQKRERNANFTKSETNILISLVKANKHIIENKKSDSRTWQEKEKTWKAIERAFNLQSDSVFRDFKHLKLKYEAMKRDTRRKTAMVRAGGGPVTTLTRAEKQVKEIILLSEEGNESQFDSDLSLSGESYNVSETENQWECSITDIKREECPVIDEPTEKSSFDKLTEENLELAKIQRQVLNEELKQKFIRRKLLEKELEHKELMYELEKQHVLMKIELLKKEFNEI